MDKDSRTNKRPATRARLILAIIALLALLPCLGLMCSGTYLWVRQAGTFSRWQSLAAPPGGGVKIVAGDPDVVYVRTASGAIYRCDHGGKRATESCWQPAQEPLNVDPETTSEHKVFEGQVKPPPGTVADTLDVAIWYAELAYEARYALLQDGTVWVWQYDVGSYLSLFVLILGPAAGLGLGVLTAVVLAVRARRREAR